MKILPIFTLIILVMGNDYDLLSGLSNYEFGKTIIATVQITLESEDQSMDAVINELKAMQKSTQQDIDDNNENSQQSQNQCKIRFNELGTVITAAESKKADDERTLPFKQDELSAKLELINDKIKQQQRIQDRQSNLEEQRKDETKDFNQKMEESIAFIDGLKKAKATISQLTSAFLQVGDVRTRLHKHLESFNSHSPYHGLVKILIGAAGDDNVSKVVQIIDELMESLQNILSVDRKADQNKEALYILQKNRYQSDITNLQASLAGLQAEQEKLKQSLLELQVDIDTKTQLLIVKNQELKDWKKTCDDDTLSFQNIRQLKINQLSIINECLDIFTTRFSSEIRSYIQTLEI